MDAVRQVVSPNRPFTAGPITSVVILFTSGDDESAVGENFAVGKIYPAVTACVAARLVPESVEVLQTSVGRINGDKACRSDSVWNKVAAGSENVDSSVRADFNIGRIALHSADISVLGVFSGYGENLARREIISRSV